MIESTAATARHKPQRPPQKRAPKKQRLAQVQITSEPGRSVKDFPDEYGDWFFFRVDHVNSNCKQWTINCREWQRSWVLEQQECNAQLSEGFHFNLVPNAVQVENGWEARHVLDEQFCLQQPAPEENPMTWGVTPGSVTTTQGVNPASTSQVVVRPTNPAVIEKASELFNNFLVTRKLFENSASIHGFDDFIFRSVVSASISCERAGG